MPSQETDVLIVGAGPTGLTLAAALAQNGVRVQIVEKQAQRSDKSKALGIHAGTLEALASYSGLDTVDRLTVTGIPVQEAFIHLNSKRAVRLDLSLIPSRFNSIWVIPQSETERILEEALAPLSVAVDRSTEWLAYEETPEHFVSTLRGPDGQTRRLRSLFIVGCDGAHSAVRRALGLEFRGAAFTADFALADVRVDANLEPATVQAFSMGNGSLLCLPLPGGTHHRLVTLLPKNGKQETSGDLTLDELQTMANKISGRAMRLSDPLWLTRFRVHHRMTQKFRQGRAFLAGDAAHIHSPAGGQGMNTGMQDALNIADKLTKVLKRGAPAALLDEYEAERMPVARGVLLGTTFFTRIALMRVSAPVAWIRGVLLSFFLSRKFVQRKLAALLSEVGVARREMARRRLTDTPAT